MVLAVVTVFVAAEDVGMPIGIAEGADGEHGAGRGVVSGVQAIGSFGSFGPGQAAGFVDNGGFFDSPDAELTPFADGHLLDQHALGGADGLKIGGNGVEQGGETVAGFVVNEDGVGEDAVASAVAGGVTFAYGASGAGGFEGVGTVSGDTFF